MAEPILGFPPKQYLGDGVWVDYEEGEGFGDALVLSTEDGIRTTNTIFLEGGVYTNLLKYVERLKEWNVKREAAQQKELEAQHDARKA